VTFVIILVAPRTAVAINEIIAQATGSPFMHWEK